MDYDWATKSAPSKTKKTQKNKHSLAREWAWQHNEQEEEATKLRAEEKDEKIGRFKLFLVREIIIIQTNKLFIFRDLLNFPTKCIGGQIKAFSFLF